MESEAMQEKQKSVDNIKNMPLAGYEPCIMVPLIYLDLQAYV